MHTKKIIMLIALSMLLISCRAAILNIENEPFTLQSSAKPALAKVTQNIILAGASLGWKMQKVKPGHMIATLHLRKHMAKVKIHYSRTKYSITYQDSHELKYDGSAIHKNYNGWIQNLSNSINTQVYNSMQM